MEIIDDILPDGSSRPLILSMPFPYLVCVYEHAHFLNRQSHNLLMCKSSSRSD